MNPKQMEVSSHALATFLCHSAVYMQGLNYLYLQGAN